MSRKIKLFTSESVCEGHPDKVCDAIADAILDEALSGDADSRIACEVACTTGMVLVMGEFNTTKYIDIPGVARRVIKEIGYNRPEYGFDCNTVAVLTYINQQSEDIAMGVDKAAQSDELDNIGAGDQGMMFGYACNETPQLMPLPITLAHALTSQLASVRKSGQIGYLRPDGKAQVSIAYDEETSEPLYVDTIVISAQHDPETSLGQIKKDIKALVVDKVIDKKLLTKDTKYFINPTGRFVKGGPHGDSGLTGRKIIVDTYGGSCPHGGGAFSGKDATKVDRSAAYYGRFVCKSVVAAGLCDRIQLQVAYAIGEAQPVSISIETFGTEKVSKDEILKRIKDNFDFRPKSIIRQLGLTSPIYSKTTNYGHFGKDGLAWERVEKLK